MTKKKVVVSWSGGKDAALSLKLILENPLYEVVCLLTTLYEETQASSVHFIPKSILKKQADALEIPIHFVMLTQNDLTDYNSNMQKTIVFFQKQGVTGFVFGDLNVEEVLPYRKVLFDPLGMELIFPLGGLTSENVMKLFFNSELETVIIVTNESVLPCSYVGKKLTKNLIDTLSPSCDVCGENGEYHTLITGGSIFKKSFSIEIAAIKKHTQQIRLSDFSLKKFTYCYAEYK
ncbi:Dph6-related ATP pyrophosphatase [Paenimyroides ceti]